MPMCVAIKITFNVMCVFSCQAMGIALQEGLLNGLKKKKRPKVMYKELLVYGGEPARIPER
jgi:hypothetical protein